MNNKIEYLKTIRVLSEVNKRLGDLRRLLYIREDERVRIEFETLIHKALRLNDQLLKLQFKIESEGVR